MLETANGLVPTMDRNCVAINSLNEDADCLVLESTVHALSPGRRCAEHGYTFRWEPWASEPTLLRPDGIAVSLKVENFVPLLVDTGEVTATTDRRHVRCMPAQATSAGSDAASVGVDDDWSVQRVEGQHRLFGSHLLPPPPQRIADKIGDDGESCWQRLDVVETVL